MDELVHATVEARGGTADVAHHFPTLCHGAQVRLLDVRGFLPTVEPGMLMETFQGVLQSLRAAIVEKRITGEAEVTRLLEELETAKRGQYVSAFAKLYIEMIAEVPTTAVGGTAATA